MKSELQKLIKDIKDVHGVLQVAEDLMKQYQNDNHLTISEMADAIMYIELAKTKTEEAKNKIKGEPCA